MTEMSFGIKLTIAHSKNSRKNEEQVVVRTGQQGNNNLGEIGSQIQWAGGCHPENAEIRIDFDQKDLDFQSQKSR
jgi:hypothetical protein